MSTPTITSFPSDDDLFSLHFNLNAHNLGLLAAAEKQGSLDLNFGQGGIDNLYNSQPTYNFGALPPTGVNTTPLTDLDPYFTSPLETLIGSDFGAGIYSDPATKPLDINEIIFSSPPTSVVGLQFQNQPQEMNKNVRASPSIISAGSASGLAAANQRQNIGQGQGLFPSVLPPPPMVSRRSNSTSSSITAGTGTPAQIPAGTAQAQTQTQAQVQSPEEKIWNGMDWGRVLDEAEEGRKEMNIPSVPNPIQGSTSNTTISTSNSSASQPASNLAAGMDRFIMTPTGPMIVTQEMIKTFLAQQAQAQAQDRVRQQQEAARQQAQLQARAQAEAHLKGYERSLLLQRFYQAQLQGSSVVANNNIDIGYGSGMGMGIGMEMFQGMTTGMGGSLNATQASASSGGPIFESGVGFAFASSTTPSSEYSFPTQSLPSQGATPVSSQRMSFAIPAMTNAFGPHSAVGTPGSVFSSVAGMGGAGSPAPGDSVSQVGANAGHGQAHENSPLVPIANIAGTDKDGFKIPATGPIRSVKGIKEIRTKTSTGPVSVIEDKGKGKAAAFGKGKKGGARTLGKGKRPPHDRGQGRKPSTSSSNRDSSDSPEEQSSRRSHDPNASRLTGTALDIARSSVLAEMDPEDVKKERRREINRRSARTLREKRKAELDEAMEVVRSLRKEVKVLREGLKHESEWRKQVEGVFKERGIDLASYGIQTPSTFSTPPPTASASRQPLDQDMDDDHAGFDSDVQGSDLEDDDDESDFD